LAETFNVWLKQVYDSHYMDLTSFTAEQADCLVTIPGGLAFVPPPLPPRLELSRELVLKDGDARGLIGELLGQSRRIEANLLIAPLRRREAILSNVIEGTYTQVEDVLLGEVTGERPETGAETVEVLKTIDAISLGQELLQSGRPLSSSMILELHALLLRSVRGEQRHPGEYRRVQVYLGSRAGGLSEARYVPPPPEQVRPLMDALVQFAGSGPVYGPLIDAALLHYQFEAIHPFEDGNGRLGRALIPLYWLQQGLFDEPVLYLGGYLAAHRQAYIDHLSRVSFANDWTAWVEFFLTAAAAEARDALRRLLRVEELMARYGTLVTAASRSSVPLCALETVFTRVYVSAGDIADATSASFPAARDAIRVLEGIGLLQPGPRLRGKQYWVASEIIDELYRLDPAQN